MVSSRSEAPMRRTGPGSASPRSRPDTSRCYRTCMSQTSEGERRGRGGRRGRGREIRIPTCANFWPQRSTTPPRMHPCNPFAAPCSCTQIAQRSVAPSKEHARSHACSPTRASGLARPRGSLRSIPGALPCARLRADAQRNASRGILMPHPLCPLSSPT
jgi:hypothetical protein